MNRAADVIIVGAGVIGLAVAYELSRRGARVRVIDARAAGQGASQASAGMLTPYSDLHGHPEALRDLAARSLDLYDAFVETVREDGGVDVEYRRCGSLHLPANDADLDGMRALAARLAERAVAARLLTPAEVHDLEPQLARDVPGGVLVPAHGYVAVQDFVRALQGAVTLRGGRLDVERAESVRADALGLRVGVAGGGEMRAPAVVIAAGSWTSRIVVEGDRPLPVRPVRGQLVTLDWPTPPLGRIVWGPDCYLVPWTSGAMLVGATVEEAGFDERATTAGVHDLVDAACDLLPQAWQAGFAGVRVGLRPATPDELPVIGASERVPGVYYATGHYRNGVLLAPITAVLLADLMLGQQADPGLAPFRPGRFA